MKLFMGFEVPIELSQQLATFKTTNKQPGLNFTKRENQHITALFLGDINPQKISDIQFNLATLCSGNKPFTLKTQQIDFSPGKNPYMFWQYFDVQEEFKSFNASLRSELKNKTIGIKECIPHISIARFSKPHKFYKLDSKKMKPITIELNKLILWQSSLDEKSNKYKKLNEFELKG
jgi:2'-5' RNA ligase